MKFSAALLKQRQQSGMHAPVQGLHAHYLGYNTQKINLVLWATRLRNLLHFPMGNCESWTRGKCTKCE